MNTAVSSGNPAQRSSTIIVDGDLACFHDVRRTPDFARQFTTARFSALALREIPYTEAYRYVTLRVEFLSMTPNPKYACTEALFRVYAPIEGGYLRLGDCFARALKDLADGYIELKRLPGWPKPAERALLVCYRDGKYASLLRVAQRQGFVEQLEQCDDPFLKFVAGEVGRGEGALPEGGVGQLMTRVTALQTAYQHLTVGLAA
ncbi:hypothetical protein [Paraburkholderia youngii]|uniref:hypothetical protein n=1 Tax=Paraburkholderia youngii TaxID=2782701 RepID=UPI003D190A5B